MAVPDFQSFMLPVLKCLSDGQEKTRREIWDCVASKMNLSEIDKAEKLPSGKGYKYENRANWSLTYLKQAKLIANPKRGIYQIIDRGVDVLKEKPKKIDNKYLSRFPEFEEFRNRRRDPVDKPSKDEDEDKTPQEYMEYGYQKIKNDLSDNLLANIMEASPQHFETLVLDLLLAMGYGGSRQEAGRVTQYTSDHGIDGIINEDKLGLDVIYIQAKRWTNPVSRPEIQKFAGALAEKRAKKGIFITSSTFTNGAITCAAGMDSKIILIDGERLAELMIEHNVGVTLSHSYDIKKIDLDYFLEE